jgi:hypothetical protein
VHGGVKVYRGNPAAARNYVEADHARVDDYYLAEGTGLAERFVPHSMESRPLDHLTVTGTKRGSLGSTR